MKPYWVTYTGMLVDGSGTCAQPPTPALRTFLTSLTRHLLEDERTKGSAVLTYGDGTIVLTSMVSASSEGNAVDSARAVFIDAITKAGGGSDMADCEDADPGWQVARLLQRATVEEVVPSPAAELGSSKAS